MRVPDAVRDQIANLYITGDSIDRVSEKLSIGREIVYGEIKRRGIERKRPRNYITPEQKAELIRLYAEGLSITEAGQRVGAGYFAARDLLTREGVVRVKRRNTGPQV